MRENLPPPHWSPTGNRGEWRWGKEKIGERQERECWQWHDDVVTAKITTAEIARLQTKKQSFLKKWWGKLFK